VAVPWDTVRRIDETGKGFAVFLKPAGIRWLPKRAFTAAAIDALRELARARLGDAARLATRQTRPPTS
jgi:hypothetical protein